MTHDNETKVYAFLVDSIEEVVSRSNTLVFAENGVAMLSSVLRSDQVALVNISIMRIFIKHRSFLIIEKENSRKNYSIGKGTSQLFLLLDSEYSASPHLL